MNKEKYLDSNGTICPFCNSNDIDIVIDIDVDCETAIQSVKCDTCKKRWTDVYKLIDIMQEDD